MEWISVNDRLPENGTLVVAAYMYEYYQVPDVACCDFYDGEFHLNTDGLSASNYDGGAVIIMDFKPTHWVELPEISK